MLRVIYWEAFELELVWVLSMFVRAWWTRPPVAVDLVFFELRPFMPVAVVTAWWTYTLVEGLQWISSVTAALLLAVWLIFARRHKDPEDRWRRRMSILLAPFR